MVFPKLGMYKKVLKDQALEHGISKLDLEILIYLAEQEWASQHEIHLSVPSSKNLIISSMKRLEQDGYIRVGRGEQAYKKISRKYVITHKSRRIVTDLYIKMQKYA